ncbi:soluble inorganic pyrophosphatase 6, chloroplastic [Populus alba]|uniref:soluble inorganic pyrophosphatase 6, chloroplastic n=1 Tax=Populus alba TaxID=43335 RepID=UPI001588E39C|nr:soluble inorganic pyrophosphatase 6, chloroplastic-like [Populus alba]
MEKKFESPSFTLCFVYSSPFSHFWVLASISVSKVLRRLFFHHTSFTRCHRFGRRRNLSPQVSPWHGIPLHLGDGAFNYVVEIPKESSAKMEVATDEQFTPIKQDTKKGKLRYYLYNINWNYGLLPQTWEDPSLANAEVEGAFGDNDPVDVVEIGERRGKIGEILKIKPLVALAMIDEGELDWKIVAISLDDPRASLVNDIDDVEKHFPVSPVLSPSSQTILHHNHCRFHYMFFYQLIRYLLLNS